MIQLTIEYSPLCVSLLEVGPLYLKVVVSVMTASGVDSRLPVQNVTQERRERVG